MKTSICVTVLFSYLFCQMAFSQNGSLIINNLLKDRKQVPYVSFFRDKLLSTGDSLFNTNPQNFIKCDDKLFVFINGTGRLYRVDTFQSSVHFKRIDETANFGYNVGAFAFSYNNHLYNLGGYGFWQMSGQLRVFNEKAKQWDIVKLNKEIPILTGITEGLLWYDITNAKIYTAYYLYRNEAIKTSDIDETKFIFKVMMLDLQKNEWEEIGNTNEYIKDKLSLIKPITMCSWGQLITIGDKINLLDFKNNQILSLDVRKDYYQSIIRTQYKNTFYCKDSTLFYGSISENTFDSVKLSYASFIPTGENLYTFSNNLDFKRGAFYLTLFIILASVIVFVGFRYWGKKKTDLHNITKFYFTQTEVIAPETSFLTFDEMEIQLLRLLVQNTSSGKTTSIEELNNILGLTKKPFEIQKKQRSDIIISVNRKHRLTTKTEIQLIQKRRTEIDKRSFEYFINKDKLEAIKKMIDTY